MILNVDEFYKLMEKKKIKTKVEVRELMKTTDPTLFNALNGGQIGATFLEQFVYAFPKEDIRKYIIFEDIDRKNSD